MADKYTNLNTKITDIEVIAISKQLDGIDSQIQILRESKKSLFKCYWISKANYYLRKKSLAKKEWETT